MYFCNIDEQTLCNQTNELPWLNFIYKKRPRSYRELAIKIAEFGHVHRHELSGVLHGLIARTSIYQDDAHIYCTPDQIE